MPAEKLIWIGLICCLSALAIAIFPDAAYRFGVDIGASWLVFGFGVFLIITSTLISLTHIGCNKR